MQGELYKWWLAVRPWSFTASVVPVVVGNVAARLAMTESLGAAQDATAHEHAPSDLPYWSWGTAFLTLAGVLSVHAAGNLTNTYWDFVSGNDQRSTASDRTLFDLGLKPRQVLAFSLVLFAIAGAIGAYVVLTWGGNLELFLLFAVGALLAFFYTAEPIRLKARALGDLTILLCYGPLPVLGVFFMQTGRWAWLIPGLLSLPPGLLSVAILHANNTRDLDKDRRARTLTLARVLGSLENCRLFYITLIALAYSEVIAASMLLAREYKSGSWTGSLVLSALPLLSLPMALRLVRRFGEGKQQALEQLVEQTAQFHLVFGLLMVIGLILHPYL